MLNDIKKMVKYKVLVHCSSLDDIEEMVIMFKTL